MITVCVNELCNYSKQIAPTLMMTLTAITTLSILLCKTKKNATEKQKGIILLICSELIKFH